MGLWHLPGHTATEDVADVQKAGEKAGPGDVGDQPVRDQHGGNQQKEIRGGENAERAADVELQQVDGWR